MTKIVIIIASIIIAIILLIFPLIVSLVEKKIRSNDCTIFKYRI